VAAAVKHGAFSPATPSEHLCEPRGAFTTLYVGGELHGCVGYPLAVAPLYRTVVETARSAALEDPRFPPLTESELQALEVSLSVLSPLFEIEPQQVEVGRHGLLITAYGRRGLLLPQVAVEHNWDHVTFMEETCRKAGLPRDAWQASARIEAFTAEIFGDNEAHL
jgi:AmmeMemoRadiSam system protein A